VRTSQRTTVPAGRHSNRFRCHGVAVFRLSLRDPHKCFRADEGLPAATARTRQYKHIPRRSEPVEEEYKVVLVPQSRDADLPGTGGFLLERPGGVFMMTMPARQLRWPSAVCDRFCPNVSQRTFSPLRSVQIGRNAAAVVLCRKTVLNSAAGAQDCMAASRVLKQHLTCPRLLPASGPYSRVGSAERSTLHIAACNYIVCNCGRRCCLMLLS
jgi:hypothetical protein